MEYRNVGSSGLKVSEICLGAMTFGRETDFDGAKAIVSAALDAGVNFFDTANSYAAGASETLLGEIIHSTREDVVIATKFGNATGPGANERGLSRVNALKAVDASLKRLKTDYIDVYYIHHVDLSTPAEETIAALDTLVRQGKVRYIGCSNYEAWRLLESIWISDTRDLARFVIYQPQYNLLVRDIEDEIVPVCELKGVGIVPWGPLAGGLLSGKYENVGATISGTRSENVSGFRNRLPFLAPNSDEIIATLRGVASELGKPLESVALRWIIERPQVSSVIIGARTEQQARANLAAAGWTLPTELADRLDAVSKPALRYPKDSELPRGSRTRSA